MSLSKIRYVLLVCVVLGVAAPVAFFTHYEQFSDEMERVQQFDAQRANAAKHAYAAGQLHGALRSLFIGPHTAERAIIALGFLNEYAETIFKISEPDSTAEIMKDVYNNQAGIVADEWCRAQEACSLKATILYLAQVEGLAVSRFAVPMGGEDRIEDYPQSVRDARDWFAATQGAIRHRVEKALQKAP